MDPVAIKQQIDPALKHPLMSVATAAVSVSAAAVFRGIKRDPPPADPACNGLCQHQVTRDQIDLVCTFFPLFTTFFASSAPSRAVIGSLSITEVGFYLDNAEFDALNCIIVEISG